MDGTNRLPIPATFTERETEILRLIAEGSSNREIAQELVISLGTVKWYARQIYNKLGVHSRTQAVAQAREAGLFDTPTNRSARFPFTPRHNLPAQITSFVGRQREITEVEGLLKTNRLLTLTGPPGTGKTRLGTQVAAGLVGNFDSGVYLVELAPISDPALVTNAIAQVLDVTERAGEPLAQTLQNFLRDRRMLLVLDNFEHILEAAPLISELLGKAPHLSILVTSREALRLYGEQEYHVLPLELPNPRKLESPSALSQYEAVELFVQRAQAVQPDFALADDVASLVGEICVRLDGLPLAIELAAARSKLLSPEMILARLESRLEMLTGGSRDLPARHQTLHATLDWSYDLLSEEEKTLLARLSVFKGGHTVASAETVCGPGLALDVLDGLESLLNKSLLWHEEGSEGEPRFYMLETIHEYARERLEESGEAEDLQGRHAEYFVTLAEQAEQGLQGARPGFWYKRLRAEHDNLQKALAWSLDSTEGGISEWGLRLVGALCGFWYYGGRSAEGRRWVERALARAETAPPALRASVLNGAGRLAYQRGDHTQGRVWNREALALYQELGDRNNSAWALVWLGCQSMGNPDEVSEGMALCEEAVALFRDANDRPGMTWALNMLGELARVGGDDERAKVAYEEALTMSRAAGVRAREFAALHNLGHVAQRQGDYARAEALLKETLALVVQGLESSFFIATALAALAGPVAANGNPEPAARLLGASEALLKVQGVGLLPPDQRDVDRTAIALRAQLGEATFEGAWVEGKAMSLEEAIAYAFGEEDE